MSDLEQFLTAKEEQDIIEAIRTAEKNTSGEIRVHIERESGKCIEERTLELFHLLKMDNTKLQNGVLIYVAITDKQFCIYGDCGINEVVDKNFWNSTKDVMEKHFKLNNFKDGIEAGIKNTGEQLKIYFPYYPDDLNELPNTISKG